LSIGFDQSGPVLNFILEGSKS